MFPLCLQNPDFKLDLRGRHLQQFGYYNALGSKGTSGRLRQGGGINQASHSFLASWSPATSWLLLGFHWIFWLVKLKWSWTMRLLKELELISKLPEEEKNWLFRVVHALLIKPNRLTPLK